MVLNGALVLQTVALFAPVPPSLGCVCVCYFLFHCMLHVHFTYILQLHNITINNLQLIAYHIPICYISQLMYVLSSFTVANRWLNFLFDIYDIINVSKLVTTKDDIKTWAYYLCRKLNIKCICCSGDLRILNQCGITRMMWCSFCISGSLRTAHQYVVSTSGIVTYKWTAVCAVMNISLS